MYECINVNYVSTTMLYQALHAVTLSCGRNGI